MIEPNEHIVNHSLLGIRARSYSSALTVCIRCVITMHNAFQSKTQLFMLMDIATGGELFQVSS